jgi:hypothetical protein
LAYGSVVNAFSENGFALFGGEPGPHLSRDVAYNMSTPPDVSSANLRVPILIVTLGAVLCIAAGGAPTGRRALRPAWGPIGFVLVFALVTPLITPSRLAIGTLFAYLGALVIALTSAASLGTRTFLGRRTY